MVVRLSEVPLIERVLLALKEEQRSFAESSLSSPAQRDAFEYGRVTGHFSGVKKAISIIEDSLNYDSEDNDHGYNRRGETRFTIRD